MRRIPLRDGQMMVGVAEICAALDAGVIDKTTQTITLEWYKELTRWHRVVREVEMYGGIVEI